MQPETKWELAHMYRRESIKGNVPLVLCPDCETEVVITAGKDSLPAFRCFVCPTTHNIRLEAYEQMLSNLREALTDLEEDVLTKLQQGLE